MEAIARRATGSSMWQRAHESLRSSSVGSKLGPVCAPITARSRAGIGAALRQKASRDEVIE
jgi:hypothetical protein